MRKRLLLIPLVLVLSAGLLITGCAPTAAPAETVTAPGETVTAPAETVTAPAETVWPQRPVEFVILAGVGGGADQYARFITGINLREHYMDQDLLPVNRTGGSGAVAMDYVLKQEGNDYCILITLNSFITTPLFQDLPFSYKDFTDVAILALDNFVLWVNNDRPWQTWGEFIADAQEESIEVCGTGTKIEDETLWNTIALKFDTQPFTYVPYPGGGDVAKALAGNHHAATVNQVSEAIPYFPDYVRPLVVFQKAPLTVPGLEDVVTIDKADPAGDFEYFQIRGIMAAPGISNDAHEGMVAFFSDINDDAEWSGFLEEVGIRQVFITGQDCWDFWDAQQALHEELFTELGWLGAGAE